MQHVNMLAQPGEPVTATLLINNDNSLVEIASATGKPEPRFDPTRPWQQDHMVHLLHDGTYPMGCAKPICANVYRSIQLHHA